MKNLQPFILRDTSNIREAMQKIDLNAKKFIAIINEHQQLVGTVTDGDIRRGILKDIPLSEIVSKIMNKKPTFSYSDSDENYKLLLEKKSLNELPILNNKKEIINIIFKEDFSDLVVSTNKNKVVLMVGGLGSRLRPLTNHFPKPMLKVGDKPILQIIIEGFKNNGFINFVLCVNYKKEIIQSYFQDGKAFGVHIEYIEENKRLGTAGALSLMKEKLDEPFFVMNGDLLTQVDFSKLLEFHSETNSIGTMCVREYEYQIPFGVIDTSEHKLISIHEKPVKKEYVNAGIYMLDPQALMHIPYDTFYDMPELFNQLIQQNLNTSVFPIHEYWMDIGQLADYEQANKDYERVNNDE